MALILKNYTNEYGITSDLYVRLDSLHTMFGEDVKGTRVAINTSCWYDVSARTTKDSKPLIHNKTWLIDDTPIKDAENMLQAGYQLLKKHFTLNNTEFEEDLNNYGENLKAKQETQQQIKTKQTTIMTENTSSSETIERL